MDDKITILMATYNGEKYIEEQLQSIFSQTYQDWELIISDDSSKDNTCTIINKIISENDSKNIKLIKHTENMGQAKNFEYLMGKFGAKNQYVMFADQDDIWLNDKISDTLLKMKELEKKYSVKTPLLVYTDLQYVDETLKEISIKSCNPKEKNLKTLLSYNFAWGCTMLLNREAVVASLPFGKYVQNHDYWVMLNISAKGDFEFLNKKTLLYRQHSDNVTGGTNRSFFDKVRDIKKVIKLFNQEIDQNKEFCQKNIDIADCKQYLMIVNGNIIEKLNNPFKKTTKMSSLVYVFSLASRRNDDK